MNDMKIFYMVYSPQGCNPPKVRFTDWGKAADAAQTMAGMYPQQEFYVMKAVAHHSAQVKVTRTILEQRNDP